MPALTRVAANDGSPASGGRHRPPRCPSSGAEAGGRGGAQRPLARPQCSTLCGLAHGPVDSVGTNRAALIALAAEAKGASAAADGFCYHAFPPMWEAPECTSNRVPSVRFTVSRGSPDADR